MNSYSDYHYIHQRTPVPKINNSKFRMKSCPKIEKSDNSQVKLPRIQSRYSNNNNYYRNSSLKNNLQKKEQNLFFNIANKNSINTYLRKNINSYSEARLPMEYNDLSYDMKE